MRILVISQYWHPENGVPQRRWSWLTNLLAQEGHEITVIAPPAHYERKITMRQWWDQKRFRTFLDSKNSQAGERIVRCGFIPAGTSLSSKALNQASVALASCYLILKRPGSLKGYRPDLIIGTVPALPTACVTWMASRVLKAPYVIDLRDAWPDLFGDSDSWNRGTGRVSLRQRLLSHWPLEMIKAVVSRGLYFSLKNATGIMLTSSHLERKLQEESRLRSGQSIPSMLTIRNVFPVESPVRRNSGTRSEDNALNVLYAGTIGRAQHLHNALEAVKICQSEGLKVNLRLVGAGAHKNALKEKALGENLAVSFEPRREASDLEDLYDWVDTALVHLTDWEPLKRAVPSKLYELMASGLHISGVVDGEAREIIERYKAGDVVEPEDPQALAALWRKLATDKSKIDVSDAGANWVRNQREVETPLLLQAFMEELEDTARETNA